MQKPQYGKYSVILLMLMERKKNSHGNGLISFMAVPMEKCCEFLAERVEEHNKANLIY